MKNKPELMEKARSLYEKLRRRWNVFFDVSGLSGAATAVWTRLVHHLELPWTLTR